VAKFAELARRMTFEFDAQVLLLWSPGAYDSPTHPGDDAKALAIRELCDDFTIFLCPTPTLQELIVVLSVAEVVVSSDGGATHLAAACERPVIALFGDADPALWHPWCRDYRIVRSGSADVVDITVQEVFDATMAMIGEAAATVGAERFFEAHDG
jgi:ADP-heptose:LPS heptosyltransferase